MRFSYNAIATDGKKNKGVIEAGSLAEATKLLIEKGLFVRKIEPKGKGKVSFKEFSFGGVSLVERVLFVKHLSTMIKSGITLSESLLVIKEQTVSPVMKKMISKIHDKVQSGQTLSSALSLYPKTFDSLFINIIKIGEESGTLEENLEYLSDELDKRLDLRRKIKGAALYPTIIFAATFGLGLVLAYFVLPNITRLFKTLSFELPLSTKILLWIAEVMDSHGLLIVLGSIFGAIAIRILFTRKFMQPISHMLLLRTPIVGPITINYNLAMMARTMGILLRTGLTIDHSIETTISTTRNYVYKKKLEKILPQVKKGKRFSDSLAVLKDSKRSPLFPLLTTKMISVGERSGNMDESFSYLADYFEKEVDNSTKNLSTILEPVLLVTIGLIVGFVAISVISPIYQVTGQFRS